MKGTSIFLLLSLFSFVGMGQEPADSGLTRLAERARLFGERIPQEKVFVQMDNTCYFLGDTIWFSAFTRRTNSGRPSKISRVLYAELWNHDGFLVERKLVEMRDGRGSGFFALPDTLYSGYFELRAYTRWQLNWGQTEHFHIPYTELLFYNKSMAKDFFRDYEKLYSRVFPVYDKPQIEGIFDRDMTFRPLRRYFKSEPTPPSLLLSLFSEGGNLVAGMPCRVAFEAAMEDGEYVEGTTSLLIKNEKIRIKNEQGEEVTEVRTENRGRGTFTFTPEAGKSYEVVFTSSDGKTAKQKLKDFEKEGVSLQVRQEGDQWMFDIHTNLDKPLGMTIMHEGVTCRFAQIKNEKLKIKSEELKAGINQVTIFDEEGRVWADRLFFVTKPELARPTISIAGLKDEYQPFEEINLDVKYPLGDDRRRFQSEAGKGMENVNTPLLNREGTGVSLSVRDAVRQDNTFDSGNIMTEMLLASEIKGFVPQPEWYFEKDDEEHRRALDLLMMTQGWRRFTWREMALPGAWEITHPAEQSQMVTGTVNKYYIDNPNEADDLSEMINQTLKEHYQALDEQYIERKERGLDVSDYNAMGSVSKDYSHEKQKNLRRVERQFEERGNIKNEVRVHAEFVHPEYPRQGIIGDMTTQKGRFRIDLPRFYGDCLFFIGAQDTTKWNRRINKLFKKKYRQYNWIQMEDDEYERVHEDAEFYVRLNFPYPRWIKPYSYYQVHYANFRDTTTIGRLITDSLHLMDEIIIRARRNGLRRLDLSKPAYVIDAYEAGNAVMDAGLITDLYSPSRWVKNPMQVIPWGSGNTGEIAIASVLNYLSDMGMYSRFKYTLYFDSINTDWAILDPGVCRRYSRLEYIDKMFIYTDYSPRREGSERFRQDNHPSVEVSLHKYPDNSRRVTYRDRRYILHGFAYQEDFYHPDYKRNPPKAGQKDHRRTLYWNPDLKLDENGEAHVTLFNNSQKTQIKVEANGMTSEGGFLYNK